MLHLLLLLLRRGGTCNADGRFRQLLCGRASSPAKHTFRAARTGGAYPLRPVYGPEPGIEGGFVTRRESARRQQGRKRVISPTE